MNQFSPTNLYGIHYRDIEGTTQSTSISDPPLTLEGVSTGGAIIVAIFTMIILRLLFTLIKDELK